jgi:hypothetical protein
MSSLGVLLLVGVELLVGTVAPVAAAQEAMAERVQVVAGTLVLDRSQMLTSCLL